MFEWLSDDGLETVYGHGRSFMAAKEAAIDKLPDEGYVEVTDAAGIDLGSRERYDDATDVDMNTTADEDYELRVVELEYWHDPVFDPEREDHPRDSDSDRYHPNDELSGVGHPVDDFLV